MSKSRKMTGAWIGDTFVTPATTQEHRRAEKQIRKRYARYRRRYPEIHGKVVDFVTHNIEDGTLYFGIRFKDKTDFSIRYDCRMCVVGADLCDAQSGDYEILRQYMRPVIR